MAPAQTSKGRSATPNPTVPVSGLHDDAKTNQAKASAIPKVDPTAHQTKGIGEIHLRMISHSYLLIPDSLTERHSWYRWAIRQLCPDNKPQQQAPPLHGRSNKPVIETLNSSMGCRYCSGQV